MNWYKKAQSSWSIMYHNTDSSNIFLISRNGLKINSEWGKSDGSKSEVERIYGMKPIFLSLDPNLFKGYNDKTLKINVVGLDLVVDIPYLYDKGAYYSDDGDGMWFEKGKLPRKLINYVDKNGMLFFDDLLNPNLPVVDACIALTKTAACEESIPVERIINLNELV